MSADQTLRGWLDGLRRRWQALTRLRVSARQAAAVAVIAGAAWAVDAATSPTGLALVGLFVAAIVAAVGAIIGLQAPLRRPPSDRQLARLAEEQNGALDDVVVTATERLSADTAGPLDGLLVRAAEARLNEVEPERVIARETMRRALRWTAAAAVVLAIALAYAWAPAWRAVQTARLYIAPPKLAVVVTPGHARIARGTPMRITARLDGLPDGATPDVPALIVAAAGAVPQPMRREGAGYVVDWPKVDADFRYRVVAGALTSPEYQVSAIDAARVTRIDLEYAFPAFTKMAPRHEEDGGDIFGPAGTTVTIRVHTDKPVRRGAIALEGASPLTLKAEGQEATTLVAGLTIAQDGAYRIGLEDIDGLSSPEGTQYFVRVLDDRPPDVRIMRPAGDRQVTKLEEVAVEARADDDHGISSLELVYAVKGRGEKVVPFARGAKLPSTSVNGTHTLFIEELDVEPGDFVTYYARARDVSRGKVSTEARSDIFFLEVRPFSEQFFAAQSQAGMGGGAGAAADLLESQKEIIVATWKLQRRAIAGQSATDVRAIAKAQGELRARAEAMAAQQGRPAPRRRRQAEPEAAPAPATTTPLARAAGSMAKAETSLGALKPNDAVPHEMAAYNELLKLAAEETERQVTRQRGGGGGGGGRTGNQDLSALFDEELLRQQQTNYENRNAAGGANGQNAEKKDDALERVKALARRQDELAEKQRELARARAAMPAEELKRQLERLTKEQEQLRREAEQLAQQMQRDGQQPSQQAQNGQSGQQQSGGQQQGGQQQGQQSGQQASGQSGGQSGSQGGQSGQQASAGGRQQQDGSRELRQAAGEMADAAKDLSRQDLEEARRRSARTLDRLRQLERRLGGEAVPDDRRRQFGEMELEARLLAEAQKRLADAARQQAGGRAGGSPSTSTGQSGSPGQRASGAGGGTPEADRRLAQEQESLAARAEALEKQLQQVNRAEAGEAAASAAIGARAELARGKPSEEMRKAAEAMRRGAGGAEGAAREGAQKEGADRAARAAETLARAADRMGGEGGGRDTAKLSEQLAGLRQARQRAEAAEAALREAVERAMKAAEARKAGGRPDPAAEAKAREEMGRLQGEFDRALNDARRLAQRDGSGAEGGRQASNRPGGQNPGQPGQAGQAGQNGRDGQSGQGGQNAAGQNGGQGGEGSRDGRQDGGYGAYGTPEGHEFSRSAPGTEAFKQDYARWDSLSKNVKDALEDLEASLADRLSDQRARDRVTAGEDDRAPAAYEDAVSRYYRSIARRPTP
jgi:hypothetical protein